MKSVYQNYNKYVETNSKLCPILFVFLKQKIKEWQTLNKSITR